MNRLKDEKSLYLLQHAENPVDWWPWGAEVLEEARRLDKPLLVSIGYSSCHWCHVMAHESFENSDIAKVMNENFVCVKVDREERPDVDHVFQTTGQLLQVQGGWPLTVFLLPDGKPFYVGTYFPPTDRYGRPGFRRLMDYLSHVYKNERHKLEETGDQLVTALKSLNQKGSSGSLDWRVIRSGMWADFDSKSGGFGGAPKFPHSLSYQILARLAVQEGREDEIKRVIFGLRKMAQGGIYDHVGGGFHRYSTDDEWLVPHFEKMLYDNALLPRAYLDAMLLPGCDPQFEDVVRGVFHYIKREMTSPDGTFYAAQDADSEGHEGKFFVWTIYELVDVAKSCGAEDFLFRWGVSEAGNFEGKNIIHFPEGWPDGEEAKAFERFRDKLFPIRERRIKPARDEKTIVSWNGMLIATLVQGALQLRSEDYLSMAVKAFTAIVAKGEPLPSVFYGPDRKGDGLLDDYAHMIGAALKLYQATGEVDYFQQALRWMRISLNQFWKQDLGLFTMSQTEPQGLALNPVQTYDGSHPSGNAVMAENLSLMSALTDDPEIQKVLDVILSSNEGSCGRAPQGFTGWLLSYLRRDRGPRVCHVMGDYSFEKASQLTRHFQLNDVIFVWGQSEDDFNGMSKKFVDQWGHHRQQRGFLLCDPSGCRPLVTDLTKIDA